MKWCALFLLNASFTLFQVNNNKDQAARFKLMSDVVRRFELPRGPLPPLQTPAEPKPMPGGWAEINIGVGASGRIAMPCSAHY